MKFKNTKRSSWLLLGLLCVFLGGKAVGEVSGTGTFAAPDPCASGGAFDFVLSGVTDCDDSAGTDCVSGTLKETCSGMSQFTISTRKGRYANVPEGATRLGAKVDTFHVTRDFLNHFKYLTANSSSGCTDGNCCPASSEDISWILLRGKAPHPNGSFPGDVTSSSNAVAGVFTYNPSASVSGSGTYKVSGSSRYSLADLAANNSTVYRARGRLSSGVEHACSASLWKADFSVSGDNASIDRPFGNLAVIQFGKNLRVLRTIANSDPIVAVGVPGASALTSGGMSAKNLNVFGGLYTNYGGNRSDYQTQKNVFLVPDSAGTTFTIKSVDSANLDTPVSNTTDIGTLTCTTLNSPSNGFCRGTLTLTAVPGETGEATCLVVYGKGTMTKDMLICSAQEPTTNDRNLKTLTSIIASTTSKSIVEVTTTPAFVNYSTSTAEQCWTVTNNTPRAVSTLSITQNLSGSFSGLSLGGSGGASFTRSSSKSNLCAARLAAFESCELCTTATLSTQGAIAAAMELSAVTASGNTDTFPSTAVAGRGIASIGFERTKTKTGQKPSIYAITQDGGRQNLDAIRDFITVNGDIDSTGSRSIAASIEGLDGVSTTDTIEVVTYEAHCFDGTDEDEDGNTDCADSNCDLARADASNTDIICNYSSETDCADGFDNDADGASDCDDVDCASSGSCPEALCMDGTDNDTDTYTDCADTDCNSDWSVSAAGEGRCEFGTEASCRDGFDNDADGDADCLDSNCTSDFACMTLSIDTHPSSQSIACGASATFTCSALASGTTATYQWQQSTDGGSTWSDIAGATSSTYTESSGQTGYQYRCIATPDNCSVDGWVQEAYLKAANAGSLDNFGYSTSISGDTIVVGAYKEGSNQTTITNGTTASSDNSVGQSGAAYVFKRTGSAWAQEAYLKASNSGSSDEFGYSVAISGDTVVVGASKEDSNQTTITNGTTASSDDSNSASGAVYVFKRNSGSWTQQAYLKAPNADVSDRFGVSVSISGDTIVVGAYLENSNQTTITNGTTASSDNSVAQGGAAYVFKRTGSTWAQEAYLKAPNTGAGKWFSYSTSISGDTIVVGAYQEGSNQTTITNGTTASSNNSAASSGAAYVFKRTGSNWAQEAYLKAPNAGVSDVFGYATAISGDTIVVGAYGEDSNQTTITNGTTANSDDSNSNSGAAYVFKRTGSAWVQEAYLKAANAGSLDNFGYSTSISGDTIVVGAYKEGSNQTTITNGTTASSDNSVGQSGAAYVFKRTGSAWAQEAYLKAPNANSSDYFGYSTSISGDTIVVGAYGEDSNQTTITNGTTASSNNSVSSGAAYVYRRSYCAGSATSTAAELTVGACAEALCADGTDNDTDDTTDCDDTDCTESTDCENSCGATYSNSATCVVTGTCRIVAGCACDSGSVAYGEECVLAATAPGAPTSVSGTAGNAQVSLTWTAPSSNGGASITDYVVQYSSDSGSTWTTFSDGTSTSTSATVTGLTNGTAYIFKVAATNSVGTGSYSSNSSSVTPVTTPGAPTSVSGTAGDAEVALTWSAPSSNGGASITDYVVQYSSNSGSTWTTFSDGTSTSTSATVTGLTNGTAYIFKVAATNSVGTGSYSSNSSSVTPAAPEAAGSCDEYGNCMWCTTVFQAPRIYGTFTVTGAGSVTYTDPDDPNNPYNGTFDLNGTYTYDSSNYYGWVKDGGRLVFDFTQGTALIRLAIMSAADNGGSTPPTFDPSYPYSYEHLWEAGAYDIDNSCVSKTVASSDYALAASYYPGVVITGSAPTVTYNPDNTNREICNAAGGVYAGVWHSEYPWWGFATSQVEECLMMSQQVDITSDCSEASSPGGDYSYAGLISEMGAGQYSVYSGCCGDGTTCAPPWKDCDENSMVAAAQNQSACD